MGIFHELLIVVGLMLVLVIGWAASVTIREGWRRESGIAAVHAARARHTCQNGVCGLNP